MGINFIEEDEKDQFDIWWENPETQRRFHCGGFSDRDIARAAWEESKRQNSKPSCCGGGGESCHYYLIY